MTKKKQFNGKKQCTECKEFKYYNQFLPKENICKKCAQIGKEDMVRHPLSGEDIFIGDRMK